MENEKLNLEQCLEEHYVSNILIVDDSEENIAAARKYLEENLSSDSAIRVTYSNSAESAIEEIKKRSDNDQFNLVLTDLDMKHKLSGCDVQIVSMYFDIPSFVVTQGDITGCHGDKTSICAPNIKDEIIYPVRYLSSKQVEKNNPETWAYVINAVLKNLEDTYIDNSTGRNLTYSELRFSDELLFDSVERKITFAVMHDTLQAELGSQTIRPYEHDLFKTPEEIYDRFCKLIN